MYPIEELEDEVVSASQQTLNMTKPPVMDSSISGSISSTRKPPELPPSSASPSPSSSSSSSSVMGKVERPAIKIYGTLMVPITSYSKIYFTAIAFYLQILILVATDDFFLLENSALTFTFILLVLLIFSLSLFAVDLYWKCHPPKAADPRPTSDPNVKTTFKNKLASSVDAIAISKI